MVKIYLPDGSQISEKEFRGIEKSPEGELVLLLKYEQIRKDKPPVAMNLGVLKKADFENFTPLFRLSCFYSLEPSEWIGGIYIPLVSLPSVRKRNRFSEHTYYLTNVVSSVRLGQAEIVKELMKTPGYEPHADWISRLRKPYVVPRI